MTYLRRCRLCGLEAKTIEDLTLFKKSIDGRYGRQNLCRECYNVERRKGGRFFDKVTENRKRWRTENPERYKEITRLGNQKRNPRRIGFESKRILLDENPRTNVCSMCGRKYPEELDEQTHMHHNSYDKSDPLADTRELCRECHAKITGGLALNFAGRQR